MTDPERDSCHEKDTSVSASASAPAHIEGGTSNARKRRPQYALPKICRTSLAILIWCFISSSAIFMTKWLFNNHFPFPLTVMTCSNIISFGWATIASKCQRPAVLPRAVIINFVVPIGLFTALEIGCSNLALKILSVSFGTILKGAAPFFTFLWGLYFGLEKFQPFIALALMMIALGIALASLGEGHEFKLFGFSLQLISTALGGLRWALTHKLLRDGVTSDTQPHMSPLTAVFYISPVTAIFASPFALVLEGGSVWDCNLSALDVFVVTGALTLVATLVFLVLMSEYWLVNDTSSLALSVAAVFKEMMTVLGGILLFSDHIDQMNILGFAICQGGILTYVFLRVDKSHSSYAPVIDLQVDTQSPSQRPSEEQADKDRNTQLPSQQPGDGDSEENELI